MTRVILKAIDVGASAVFMALSALKPFVFTSSKMWSGRWEDAKTSPHQFSQIVSASPFD
jgi:hypothetical protein